MGNRNGFAEWRSFISYFKRSYLSGFELAEFIKINKITTVTLPPSVLSVLPIGDYESLKTLITAGESISNKLVSNWKNNRKYFNAYGPTETTVCAAMLSPEKDYPKGPPIGKSIYNFQTYILDSALMPLGIGIPGELCIGGIGLARGDINRPELTAKNLYLILSLKRQVKDYTGHVIWLNIYRMATLNFLEGLILKLNYAVLELK